MARTSKEYREKIKELETELTNLYRRMRRRAIDLINANPEVRIPVVHTNLPSFYAGAYAKDYKNELHNCNLETILHIMETIEKDIADKHPHKQIRIEGF